jgi:hypothetical protein
VGIIVAFTDKNHYYVEQCKHENLATETNVRTNWQFEAKQLQVCIFNNNVA